MRSQGGEKYRWSARLSVVASAPSKLTLELKAWGRGDTEARERIIPVVYEELRRLARRYMRDEGPGRTLQTTALVNEAYLRLIDIENVNWQDRTHFFAVSARIMRRILVDSARARKAGKRGGGAPHISLEQAPEVSTQRAEELIALDEALDKLSEVDGRKAQVVELKFFSGLSVEETAAALDVSSRSVVRDWNLAKAWLMRELEGESA